ncbi:MAG: hypothetical protein ACE5OZ_18375 [Candidatus Heimdallarchaeota archaeon]
MITVLHAREGSKAFRVLLIRLLLRHYAQHPVILDTVNQLPVRQLVAATHRQRAHHHILPSLHIARAFNYHQITESLTKQLPAEVAQTGARLVILLGFGEQYLSDEARQNLAYDQRDAIYALQELTVALGSLKSLVLEHQLYCLLLTSLAPRSATKSLGGSFLAHSAGVIVQKRQEGREVVWELLEHPARGPRTVETALHNGHRVPQRLDSFLPASVSGSLQEWIQSLAKQARSPVHRSLDFYLKD